MLTDDQLNALLKHFEKKHVKRNTILLHAGKSACEIYFVKKGCLRLYYQKDGMDISAFFFTENMFAGAYDSFITKRPSRHYIAALEDCELLSISYPAFQQLYVDLPEMNEIMRKIIEERFLTLHDLFTSQILDSPEERYIRLLDERPDLLNRIAQHHIATFLGVTPVSLSRIRNRVVKRRS